jgi:simple sugar transport system permease protein
MELFVRREKPVTSVFTHTFIILGAVAAALICGAILMLLWGANPLAGYGELLHGMFGSTHNISESLVKATPLLLIALGIAVAFHSSMWNIGAEGQFYIGALFSAWIAVSFPQIPGLPLWLISMIAGVITAAVWAGFVGFLKARFGTNEIIVTVMMNYIAAHFVQWMLSDPIRETQGVGVGYPQTDVIPEAMWLPRILPGMRLHLGFLFVLVFAVAVYFLLWHTTFGYGLRAVGKNTIASQRAGIKVKWNMVLAMAISGGMAGLAGHVEVTGVHHRLLYGISPGYGFLAIVVTLLGNRNPFGILVAGILLASLDFGAQTMQRGVGIPVSLVKTIEYLMVVLIVGANILRTHRFVPFETLRSRVKK